MLGVSPVYRWCVAVYREFNIILLNKKNVFAYHNFEGLTNLAHLYILVGFRIGPPGSVMPPVIGTSLILPRKILFTKSILDDRRY